MRFVTALTQEKGALGLYRKPEYFGTYGTVEEFFEALHTRLDLVKESEPEEKSEGEEKWFEFEARRSDGARLKFLYRETDDGITA